MDFPAVPLGPILTKCADLAHLGQGRNLLPCLYRAGFATIPVATAQEREGVGVDKRVCPGFYQGERLQCITGQ